MGYLTPNSLSGSVTLQITIPDDVLLKAAVVGSITPLVFEENWELYGSQTPADTAAAMASIVDQLGWNGAGAPAAMELNEVYLSTATGFSSGVATKVLFDTVVEGDDYNTTNDYFLIPSDGIYQMNVGIGAISNANELNVLLHVDGNEWRKIGGYGVSNNPHVVNASVIRRCTANEQLDIRLYPYGVFTSSAAAADRVRATLLRLSD